jgi:Uma2 family endonuclease
VELDPQGYLLVTPGTDPHERAISVLHAQVVRQLPLPDDCVLTGLAWKRASGYTNVPVLTVVSPDLVRTDDSGLAPLPLLVAEVTSPSTKAIDHARKLDDYSARRSGLYLLVDLPGSEEPTVEVHDFALGYLVTLTGEVVIGLAGTEVHLVLTRLT